MNRCYNVKRRDYAHYGGRGIDVCKRWHKFENFAADMPPRPPGATLERINNAKRYSKKNCRWASRKAQAQNRRTTVYVHYAGVCKNMAQWAQELSVSYSTLNWRRHQGWTDAEIINGRH
jgi:hypothetical protein